MEIKFSPISALTPCLACTVTGSCLAGFLRKTCVHRVCTLPAYFWLFSLFLTRTIFWALEPNQLHLTRIWILCTLVLCRFCEEKRRWQRQGVCAGRAQGRSHSCSPVPASPGEAEPEPALLRSPISGVQAAEHRGLSVLLNPHTEDMHTVQRCLLPVTWGYGQALQPVEKNVLV